MRRGNPPVRSFAALFCATGAVVGVATTTVALPDIDVHFASLVSLEAGTPLVVKMGERIYAAAFSGVMKRAGRPYIVIEYDGMTQYLPKQECHRVQVGSGGKRSLPTGRSPGIKGERAVEVLLGDHATRVQQRGVLTEWAWYQDQAPAATVLVGSRGSAGIKAQPMPIARTGLQVRAGDERSAVDWQSVSCELSRSGESDPSEPVAARAAVLAGRNAVLLPEDGDRVVWLLDPHAPPKHRVARVDVSDLEPGHVIILRTSGGGDLIVPIANEILGDQAPALRQLQRRWKEGLRSWVQHQGTLSQAAAALRRAGSARANLQNLQNWLSERSLRTDDRGDWHAIMAAASLASEEDRIWRAMGRLHSAHLEAGKSIGRRLREMANTEPLDTWFRSCVARWSVNLGSDVRECARS